MNYFTYLYHMRVRDVPPLLTPLDMKTKISKTELMERARTMDASSFDDWCDGNNIHTSWVDVENIMDFNEGYYLIEIVEYALEMCFYNGELEMISEIELENS